MFRRLPSDLQAIRSRRAARFRKRALQGQIRIAAAGAAGELARRGVTYILKVGDAEAGGDWGGTIVATADDDVTRGRRGVRGVVKRGRDFITSAGRRKRKRDFTLRRPTASQERSGKKKSACSVRNDGVGGGRA